MSKLPSSWEEAGKLMAELPARTIQEALGCTSQWAYALKKGKLKGHVSRMKQVSKLLKALGFDLMVVPRKA